MDIRRDIPKDTRRATSNFSISPLLLLAWPVGCQAMCLHLTSFGNSVLAHERASRKYQKIDSTRIDSFTQMQARVEPRMLEEETSCNTTSKLSTHRSSALPHKKQLAWIRNRDSYWSVHLRV